MKMSFCYILILICFIVGLIYISSVVNHKKQVIGTLEYFQTTAAESGKATTPVIVEEPQESLLMTSINKAFTVTSLVIALVVILVIMGYIILDNGGKFGFVNIKEFFNF